MNQNHRRQRWSIDIKADPTSAVELNTYRCKLTLHPQPLAFAIMFGYCAFDTPPPHVPSHVVHVSTILLVLGGSCYIVSHFLRIRASARTKSYDWPLLAMVLNTGGEITSGFLVPAWYERAGTLTWGLLSLYGIQKMFVAGRKREWGHAPLVERNLWTVFGALYTIWSVGVYLFSKWFLENEFGAGRVGRTGPHEADWVELAWWTALTIQAGALSSQLTMLFVRGSTRGTPRAIWVWHGIGTLFGLYGSYGWRAYWWPEAHGYVTSLPSLWLLSIAIGCDYVAYPLLWNYIVAKEKAEEIAGNTQHYEESGEKRLST